MVPGTFRFDHDAALRPYLRQLGFIRNGSYPRISGVAFDLDRYKATVAPPAFGDLDLDAFRERALDAATIRCIRYIEYHTVCHLRDLLLTRAHRDPEVTGFLGLWRFEEYWHGEALAAVLAAHDEPNGATRIQSVRESLGWRDRV